ncbi:hypothetical protein M422DRAFT_248744 [Sphaerobolus stellatus SS14]|nr:hypothetical protein M422DRAFT_248744 [Sphaerobolus stellatus SS14]
MHSQRVLDRYTKEGAQGGKDKGAKEREKMALVLGVGSTVYHQSERTVSLEKEMSVGILLGKTTLARNSGKGRVRRSHTSDSSGSGTVLRFEHSSTHSSESIPRIIGPSGEPLQVFQCELTFPPLPTSTTSTPSSAYSEFFDYSTSITEHEKIRGRRSEDMLRAQTLENMSMWTGAPKAVEAEVWGWVEEFVWEE